MRARRRESLKLTALVPVADLSHVRLVLSELRTQQKALNELLQGSFVDVVDLDPEDGFPKKMFRFAREADERLLALTDLVTVASNTFQEALKYYGEDSKSITSTEDFFGVFKTFVTSYKVSRLSWSTMHQC